MEPSPDDVPVWVEHASVRSIDIDASHRATPLALCDLLQEVAGNHAHHLGVAIDQIGPRYGETWMLHRLRVRFDGRPRWRDAVTVETWPCGVDRIYAVRDFCVRDADGRVLVEASSTWLVVDLAARRIVRDSKTRFSWVSPRPRVMPDGFARRLPSLDVPAFARDFVVRPSEIDMNGHVNHVHMLAWALDTLPAKVTHGRELAELEAEFVNEAHVDTPVRALCAPEGDDGRWLHAAAHGDDGRVLLKARTVWRTL